LQAFPFQGVGQDFALERIILDDEGHEKGQGHLRAITGTMPKQAVGSTRRAIIAVSRNRLPGRFLGRRDLDTTRRHPFFRLLCVVLNNGTAARVISFLNRKSLPVRGLFHDRAIICDAHAFG
ncbi:hypothetical protein, partial [Bradyrhizobium sp.]|uniref:hypothetical protein n=1 Tax=Bradyrhizobium sp. TaxID=376 RepID=UPI003C5BE45D